VPKHKLAVATIGLMAMPGLIFAGYPDVPRSHWASSSVDKVGQVGVMTARSDGRFHGEKAATRYEVAAAVSKAMAEFENRLVTEGRSPEDIVPYIERINLYVADEIDHLKQSQKELRATLNEILERLERREAHSTPLPPPAPPMGHPHKSPTPHTELRASTKEVHEQKIHAVEGATTVNTHTYEATKKVSKGRTSSGKIAAVEGAIEIKGKDAHDDESPIVTEAPFAPAVAGKPAAVAAVPAKIEAKPAAITGAAPAATPAAAPAAPATAPAAEGKKWPSDEAAWDQMPEPTKEEEEAAMMEGMDGIDAAPAPVQAKPEAPKKAAKGKSSKPSIPRAAPVNTSSTPKVDSHHAGAVVEKTEAKKATKSKKAKKEAKADKAAKPVKEEKPKVEEKAKVEETGAHQDEEIFESPEVSAGAGEPSDEELSNWKPDAPKPVTVAAAPVSTPAVAPVASAPTVAPAAVTATAAKTEEKSRSGKASSILSELRSRAKK
jgi:hypothetical protein